MNNQRPYYVYDNSIDPYIVMIYNKCSSCSISKSLQMTHFRMLINKIILNIILNNVITDENRMRFQDNQTNKNNKKRYIPVIKNVLRKYCIYKNTFILINLRRNDVHIQTGLIRHKLVCYHTSKYMEYAFKYCISS